MVVGSIPTCTTMALLSLTTFWLFWLFFCACVKCKKIFNFYSCFFLGASHHSHHPATFGGHRHCGSGEMLLIWDLISKDHMIEGFFDFMGRGPLM